MPVDPVSSCPSLHTQVVLALMLSAVAGYIDAFGWITLFHVYTANMSGNAVAFGVRSIHGGWTRAIERGVPVLFFALGVGVSELAMEIARRYGRRRIIATALLVEVTFLLGLLLGAVVLPGFPLESGTDFAQQRSIPAVFLLLIALAATAMGVQNASVRRVGAMSVHTTHITGAITSMMERFAALLTWLYDRMAGHSARRKTAVLRIALRRSSLHDTLILLGMLLIYVGGAVAGAMCVHFLSAWCLFFPIGMLLLIAAYECRRPTPILQIGHGAHTPRGKRTP